jgi:hypothetical protein
MIELVTVLRPGVAILTASRTAAVLVTAQAVPVIGGFQPGLVDMILVAVVGLAF